MGNSSINWLKKDWDKLRSRVLSPLAIEFYQRNTLKVAQDLLGKVLVVKGNPDYDWDDSRAEVTAGRIVETEAYRADDPASHSCSGETPRCSVMFGEAGVAYVYFIYGMYEMLNFVTEPKGDAGAVLIRAIEPVYGQALMEKRRNNKKVLEITNGPGRLCRALGIQMSDNRQSLMGPRLFVIDDGFKALSISKSPRVGIRLGTESLWRFYVTGNSFVSRTPQNALGIPIRGRLPERSGARSLKGGSQR